MTKSQQTQSSEAFQLLQLNSSLFPQGSCHKEKLQVKFKLFKFNPLNEDKLHNNATDFTDFNNRYESSINIGLLQKLVFRQMAGGGGRRKPFNSSRTFPLGKPNRRSKSGKQLFAQEYFRQPEKFWYNIKAAVVTRNTINA